MKKRVLSMLMVMIMMVSMLSVSVFAADPCTHETMDWKVEGGNCYQYCTADGCNYTTNIGSHADTDSDFACNHCGGHIHDMTAFDYDENQHWNVCADSNCTTGGIANAVNHTMVENDDPATADKLETECACGYKSFDHVHVWATTWSNDDTNHWYECACVEKSDEAAHTMVQSGTTNKCSVCEYSEHVHVYSSTVSKDADYHWYECECGDKKGYEMHYDHNSSYTCDVCNTNIPVKKLESLTVTGASEPSEGLNVDFTVSAAEDRFGTPVVKWNRVVDLSKNTSVALGEGSKYAAGSMYNTSILVPMNSQDEISEDIQITLNGVTVPYYTTDAAFQNAIKSFEGRYTVYAAKAMWTNDYLCICISVQYPTTAGTHSHDFGNGWLATPAKHYLKCVACGEVPEAEYHYDTDKSGFCDVCDYNMNYYNPNAPTYPDGTTAGSTGSGTGTHTHSYSADWVEDISNHWKQCTGCGAKTQTAAHADLNNTGKCDVCGFVMKAEDGHTHAFATEWTETFAQHYKVCSCGAKNEIAAHVDLNNTGKCDTCGYAMTTLSNNGIVADTGDDNATFLWMAAFAVSVLGAGATVMFARKKREE